MTAKQSAAVRGGSAWGRVRETTPGASKHGQGLRVAAHRSAATCAPESSQPEAERTAQRSLSVARASATYSTLPAVALPPSAAIMLFTRKRAVCDRPYAGLERLRQVDVTCPYKCCIHNCHTAFRRRQAL